MVGETGYKWADTMVACWADEMVAHLVEKTVVSWAAYWVDQRAVN